MIIRVGNTNLRHNGDKINGKLIVTNQRIYFKTFKADNFTWDKEILPDEISELIYFNTSWILPKGLNIKTKDGEEILFEVNNRGEWAKVITRLY
jgi:hypothetical protein